MSVAQRIVKLLEREYKPVDKKKFLSENKFDANSGLKEIENLIYQKKVNIKKCKEIEIIWLNYEKNASTPHATTPISRSRKSNFVSPVIKRKKQTIIMDPLEVHKKYLKAAFELFKLTKANKTLKNAEEIDALHTFNDIKDATQYVFGKIATQEKITISEVHDMFDVKEDSFH